MSKDLTIITSGDKVPPQAPDIEINLLGLLINYPDIIHDIEINESIFYRLAHQYIFQAIKRLSETNSCDLSTVTQYLHDNGKLKECGGVMYITKLIDNAISPHMAQQYAAILKEKYMRREYIRLAQMFIGLAYDERGTDIEDLLQFVDSKILAVSGLCVKKEPRKLISVIDEILKEIEQIQAHQKRLIGVPSGYVRIDRCTGGWQPGDLIIIAGRPSMGKTAVAHSLALNAGELKSPVAFFSLEMSAEQIGTRFLSGASGYDNLRIRNAEVSLDRVVDASYQLQDLPIYIDDTAGLSVYELRSKVKRMVARYGVKLCLVDYLQLIRGEGETREQEVSYVSRNLKSIAKEFNIPVIAFAQLNREVEARAERYPRLSDLRESGAIEQDADIVIFLYRPAYYGFKSTSINGIDYDSKGLIVIDCQKHRNGSLFKEQLYHNETFTVISDEKIVEEKQV